MKKVLWPSAILLLFVWGWTVVADEGETQNVRKNLALHCNVFCRAGNNPEYAVDGHRDGYFHTAMISPENYLEVDIGSLREVDGVRVFFWWGDSRYYRYYITGSADGKNWEELLDGRNNTEVSSKEGTGKDFSWRKIRFVRAYVIYNSSNMASHIREIEVYGK